MCNVVPWAHFGYRKRHGMSFSHTAATASTFPPPWLAHVHTRNDCVRLFVHSQPHGMWPHMHFLRPRGRCCITKLWKMAVAIDDCDEMLKGFIYFRKETVQDEGFVPRCLLSCHKWRGFLLRTNEVHFYRCD